MGRRKGSARHETPNQFQHVPGDKVDIETMRGCCVRLWYSKWAVGGLPRDGILECPGCGKRTLRDQRGWWFDPTGAPTSRSLVGEFDSRHPEPGAGAEADEPEAVGL